MHGQNHIKLGWIC